MEIKRVCVVGGGRMGRQIALNAAVWDFPAVVYDIDPDVCRDVKTWAGEYLAGRVAKGKLTGEQAEIIKAHLRVESDLSAACRDADCIIEAIVEIETAKHEVFRRIAEAAREDAVIATNSSFMVSSIFAGDVKNPARLCNMHFYNPALVMKFVEVVQGPHTDPAYAEAAYNFCKATGKMPIWQKKEIPGFAGNYLLSGLVERARYLVQNGYCSYEDVDIAMEYGFNHPMGPFRLNDLTGIDLTFDIMKQTYARTGKKPDMYDVYEDMVKKGYTGRSAGRGFYEYPPGKG